MPTMILFSCCAVLSILHAPNTSPAGRCNGSHPTLRDIYHSISRVWMGCKQKSRANNTRRFCDQTIPRPTRTVIEMSLYLDIHALRLSASTAMTHRQRKSPHKSGQGDMYRWRQYCGSQQRIVRRVSTVPLNTVSLKGEKH